MARKRELLGKWISADGEWVWVYKSGRSFYLSHGNSEHLCHPSIRGLDDTKREAYLVFHFSAERFEPV